MRSGYYSIMLAKHSIRDAARIARSAGYDDLAINCDDIHKHADPHLSPHDSIEACQSAAEVVRSEGLGICALSANYNLFVDGEAGRRKGIDYIVAIMDRARAMGVQYVHGYSGDLPDGRTPEEMFEPFVETFQEILMEAEKREMQFGLECPAPCLYPQFTWHERIIDALDPLPLNINYDPSHFEVVGDDPADVARRLSGRIKHVHIKDGRGRLPDFSFPPLGEGTIDFREVIGALSDGGYDDTLTVEYEADMFGWPHDEPHVLAHSRNFLRSLGV